MRQPTSGGRGESMITNDLQKRIHFGDREAFLAIYDEYGPGVYTAIRSALGTDALARSAVKQAFLTLYEEILTATEDFDIPVRIRELAQREITLMRLVCSETCTLCPAADPEPELASARGAYMESPIAPAKLPPLERERAYRQPRRALFARTRRDRQRRPARGFALKALILLLDLLLVWALAGVLMTLGYLPAFDLGYSWFNQTVLPLLSNLH